MKKIRKIIIGTHNRGKYKEIANLLPIRIKKYSPNYFKIKSPKENGKSYKENSYLKAKFFSQKTGLTSISDDSGLEIKKLNYKPGIFSARWAGQSRNFDLGIKKIFEKMKKINKNWASTPAAFICSLTIYYSDNKYITKVGKINGKIINQKRGNRGFGYDPIFIPKNYKKTFGEMKLKKKMYIDHRFKAFSKIKKYII